MRLVTVATRSEGYFPWFVESCKRHGMPLHVLGWGQKWQGFNMKLALMLEFLRSQEPDEIVCYTDAYDVLVLQGPEQLLEAYHKLSCRVGKPIIVGSDNALYPAWTRIYQSTFFGKCEGQSLNAGTWIGPAGVLRDALERMEASFKANPGGDDQILLTKECSLRPHLFHCDTQHELFLVVSNLFGSVDRAPHVSIEDSQVRYEGRLPCILHAPGCTDMTHILRQLGYRVSGRQVEDQKMYRKHYLIRAFKHHAAATALKLVLLLGACALVVWWLRRRPRSAH